MTPQPQILAIVASSAVLIFVLASLRRGVLREKYAVLWLATGALLVVLSWFPDLLVWAAAALGVQLPSNLLFFLAAVLLLLVSVQLSYEISRVEERSRRLAEEVALLANRIDSLERWEATHCADDDPVG